MEKIRAGVIGAGSMGRHHVRVLAELEETELIGFSDVDGQKTAELAAKYGCENYPDYHALLAQKPDLTVIAVPTSLHFEVGKNAIEAGSHILVEKPIADTVENAEALCATAKTADRLLFVGHIERFSPAVESAKNAIEQGLCGEIFSVANLRIGQVNQRIFDTGIILDLAIHDIDLISYLLNSKAESVFSVAHRKIGNFEDHASIMLKFPMAKTGIIETCWLMPHRSRQMFITGDKGFLLVDLISRELSLIRGGDIEIIPCPDEEPLKREHLSALKSIVDGTPPFIGGEDATYNLAAAIAATESYKSNRAVDINF